MKEETLTLQEQVSALVDSECHGYEKDGVIALLKREPELQKKWAMYHLIGKVLQKREQSVSIQDGLTLHARVQAALANESFAVRAGEFDRPIVLNTYHLQEGNNDELRSAT